MKLLTLLALSAMPIALLHAQEETISDSSARLEMARVLRDGGKLDESIAEFGKVVAADPSNFEAAGDYAQVLVWAGKTAEAEKVLAGIPTDKLTATGLDAAIDLDILAGRGEQAEKKIREVLASAPEDEKSQLRLAEVLSWRKQYSESLAIYAKLVEANPDDVQLRRKYAQVLGWAGQSEAAAEQWKISLQE